MLHAGCKLIGGKAATVKLKRFSTLAPNVVLAAGSDDYIAGMASLMVPTKYKGNIHIGTIELGRHCVIGAKSTVMPDVVFGDGAALGAQSLAKKSLDSWTLYAGIPAKRIKERNREKILQLESKYLEENFYES